MRFILQIVNAILLSYSAERGLSPSAPATRGSFSLNLRRKFKKPALTLSKKSATIGSVGLRHWPGANIDIRSLEDTILINKVPVATIEMQTGGIIRLELYYEIAPNTVKNFIWLSNKGFYDGTVFHRVIKGFVIQGGDPDGTGMGGPGYRIKGEFTNNHHNNSLSHERGVLSMARQGNPYRPADAYDTAGSQFFILHGDAPYLDKDYAAFGMVVEGMDVVDAIAGCVTGVGSKPVVEQKVKSIRVETFGQDFGEPEKIEA